MNESYAENFYVDYNRNTSLSSKQPLKDYIIFAENFTSKNQDRKPQENQINSQNNSNEIRSQLQQPIKWEANLYEYKFHPKVFLKAFFFYSLYFAGFAPLIKLLGHFGKPYFHNLMLYSSLFEKKMILYSLISPLLYLPLFVETNSLFTSTLILMFGTFIFVVVCQASMLAYSNEKFPELLNSAKLTLENMKIVSKLEDLGEHDELQATISRLNIDISSLYFTFLERGQENYSHLKKEEKPRQSEMNLIEENNIIFCTKTLTVDELLDSTIEFQREVFNKRYLDTDTRYDKTHFSGYSLAYNLLKLSRKIAPSSTKLRVITYLSSIQGYISFRRQAELIYKYGDERLLFFIPCFIYYVLLITGVYYTIIFLDRGIDNIKRRLLLMREMSELISTRKRRQNDQNEKSYPNINVFDYMSLRTWVTLRKIFMHIGDRQMESIGLAVTLFTGSHLITMAILVLNYIGSFKLIQNDFLEYLINYSIGSILILFFLAKIVVLGSSLNQQYEIHRNLIRKNKSIVVSVFRLYSSYLGEKPIEPKNYVEAEGFRLLKEEFGENYSEEKMKEKLELLINTYDDILQEIEFEEKQYPFQVLGIPITRTLVKAIGTGLVSVAAALISKAMSSK